MHGKTYLLAMYKLFTEGNYNVLSSNTLAPAYENAAEEPPDFNTQYAEPLVV